MPLTTFSEKERKYLLEKNKLNMKVLFKGPEKKAPDYAYTPETILNNIGPMVGKCKKKK